MLEQCLTEEVPNEYLLTQPTNKGITIGMRSLILLALPRATPLLQDPVCLMTDSKILVSTGLPV